jgi:hypothetical protein
LQCGAGEHGVRAEASTGATLRRSFEGVGAPEAENVGFRRPARDGCMNVTRLMHVAGTQLGTQDCSPTQQWSQRWRMLPVASVTCKTRPINAPCGLPR